jgi:metallophosphoesterase (TIGR03767 family)
VLTVRRRLAAGPILRTGSAAPYRGLIEMDGEPHAVRTELTGPVAGELPARRGALLALVHLTDLHVTDVESPARFEFLNRFAGDPRFRELLTMQRPQEALNAHAIAAMVRAVNEIEAAPVSGSPLDLLVMTGDAIDNAQWNELATFMSLFDGGLVSPGSGGPEFEGVQAPGWPEEIFWKPDGGAYGRDQFRLAYGFPLLPGLLDRGLRTFEAPGLRIPWIGCHGNHEQLCQGVGAVTPELALAMVAGRKPIALAEGFDPATAVELFVARPEAFMSGPTVAVTPDAARRPAGLQGFVEAHFRPAARPDGHGFTATNRRHGTAYYVHDTRAVRLVTLDTACPAGGAGGCIDREQVAWLEERLAEVHAVYVDARGETVRTANENRLVVILSHHPLFTLSNHRAPDSVDLDDLLRVLHRFPNVVLWLNGHVHMNIVQPHANRAGMSNGFWEVTTSSLVDWPGQGRVVEIFDAGSGRLVIACTMIDHDGVADPGPAVTPPELAGLHRQLAANDPLAGMGSPRAGTQADRNVLLTLPAPFELPH